MRGGRNGGGEVDWGVGGVEDGGRVRQRGEGVRSKKKREREEKKQEKVGLLGEIKCNFTVNLL